MLQIDTITVDFLHGLVASRCRWRCPELD